MAGEDADYHQRDLFDAIERGDYPSWTLKMQIMPFEEAKTYRFNPFDLTKVWPHGDYPLIEVGTMTLNRNVDRLPHRDRAGGVRAEQPGARHRPEPGQDAAGPRVLLRRRAPRPARRQLQADPGQRAARSPVHSYSKDGAMRIAQRHRPGVRAELQGRPGGRPERVPPRRHCGTPTATWSAPPTRCAPTTTTAARPARWCARCWTTRSATGWWPTSSATSRTACREPVLARAFEYWRNIDTEHRRPDRAGGPRRLNPRRRPGFVLRGGAGAGYSTIGVRSASPGSGGE